MTNPRLLLVDDEPNILKALQRLFFDEDYKVSTANSGEEALEILQGQEVDLIISDYRMPGMTGTHFFKEARLIQPDAVRIILSGYAEVPALTAAINEGNIYQFIFKPWNDEDLKNIIRLALQQKFLALENRKLADELQLKNLQLQKHSQELEHLVEERSTELFQQYKVLEMSQEVLENLPIGIIGISNEGIIVLMNDKAKNIFQTGLGENICSLLPADLNELYTQIETDPAKEQAGCSMIADHGYRVMFRELAPSGIKKGTIVILHELFDDVAVPT
ncbi:MAG: response regulator [bacterium]|nr:response regulator [bacterium]